MSGYVQGQDLLALTLWRPWPDAIFRLPESEQPLWLALHAGKQFEPGLWPALLAKLGPDARPYPAQHIVGLARLAGVLDLDCMTPKGLELARQRHGAWLAGRYGWVLADVLALPHPVACPGQRGLWALPPHVAGKVLAQLPRPAVAQPQRAAS